MLMEVRGVMASVVNITLAGVHVSARSLVVSSWAPLVSYMKGANKIV